MIVPIQATPYLRLVKRLVLGQGSLNTISYRQDVLCPEEKMSLRPAVFLPGQIEKVEDRVSGPWGAHATREDEIADTIATTATYAPTIAYHIKDAVLFDGCIYVGRFKHPIADRSLFDSKSQNTKHIKFCALASSYLGTKFFGHWLADDCTRYLLAKEFATPLCLRSLAYRDQQQYQTYFSQDWTPVDRARIEHLVVFQDFSQNSSKRKRYRILRDRIRAHFPGESSETYVYLRRGKTGEPRIIENEDEIVDALAKRGFKIVDIATDRLDHIIRTLSTAKIVISLEGSHNQHITFAAPEKSGLLVLEPSYRFSAFQRAWSECLGIRYGFVVGDGYHFSVQDILRTADLLLNKVENSS